MNMLQAIKYGADVAVAADPRPLRQIPKPCPTCGIDAPLASKDIRWGYFTIACSNDLCPLPLCVEGDALEEVWAAWERGAV
jgi:hypothetical protein